MKSVSLTLLATLTLLVMGCEGQNPLKRQSDPVGNKYPNASQANEPYVPGQRPQTPVGPNNDQFVCFHAIKVDVEKARANNVMLFTAGHSGEYTIKIRSINEKTFNARNLRWQIPGGDFTAVGGSKDNSATYKFRWTPAKSRKDNVIDSIKLEYTSELCGKAQVELTLIVSLTTENPTVEISGLPQVPLQYGDKAAFEIPFEVIIDDPASSAEIAPSLIQPFSFDKQARSGESWVLDASKAANCDEASGQFLGGTKWKFSCKFHYENIAGLKDHFNTERTVNATFSAVAVSNANEQKSAPSRATVRIKFNKVETKTEPGASYGPGEKAPEAKPTAETTKKPAPSVIKKGVKS